MKIWLSVLAVGSVCVSGAWDAEARFGRGAGGHHGLHHRLGAFDLDGDGVLSEEEREAAKVVLEQRRQDLLDEFDVDEDGMLSEEERDAVRAARFDEKDTNDDGVLDLDEFVASLEERIKSHFDRLDQDDDGEISKDEYVSATRRRK